MPSCMCDALNNEKIAHCTLHTICPPLFDIWPLVSNYQGFQLIHFQLGFTPLMQAAYGGHTDCLSVMLSNKADPNLVAKVIIYHIQ